MTSSSFFDELSRLAGSAAGTMGDMRREVDNMICQQMEHWLDKADVVRRDEMEALRHSLHQALERIEALEEKLSAQETASPAKPAKKTAKNSSSQESAKKDAKKE